MVKVWLWPLSVDVSIWTELPFLTEFSWSCVIVNVWLCPPEVDVWREIPPVGGVSTSVFWIVMV